MVGKTLTNVIILTLFTKFTNFSHTYQISHAYIVYVVDEQNTADNNTELYKKYKDVFDGLGCISDVLYHIDTDPSYQPEIHPTR